MAGKSSEGARAVVSNVECSRPAAANFPAGETQLATSLRQMSHQDSSSSDPTPFLMGTVSLFWIQMLSPPRPLLSFSFVDKAQGRNKYQETLGVSSQFPHCNYHSAFKGCTPWGHFMLINFLPVHFLREQMQILYKERFKHHLWKSLLPPLNFLDTFVKYQLTTGVWVYFWTQSIPLMYVCPSTNQYTILMATALH